MINATAISEDKVVVKITGGLFGNEFETDLAKFKRDVPYEHRSFDGTKFIVRHADKVHVPYIKAALKDFKQQMAMPL